LIKERPTGRFFYVQMQKAPIEALLQGESITGILETERQVSPGVVSGRLHPAPLGAWSASGPLPRQAFPQRLSVARATYRW
jgi:hypothetical protein